jgi:hypothetical protein
VPRAIDDEHIEPAIRALLGAIDIGDGGTSEQRGVSQAFGAGYWDRPDLDLRALAPFDPVDAAAGIPFSVIDHLALAHLPRAEVRKQFGVPARSVPRH